MSWTTRLKTLSYHYYIIKLTTWIINTAEVESGAAKLISDNANSDVQDIDIEY